MNDHQEHKETIVAVDDQPANLKLLEEMLRQQGYRVRSFPRGRMALAAAIHEPPDLMLLDINMPEMNGYDVCEQLKSIEKLAAIPVIFLSALNETEDKVKAFRAGGVDYITKPFQIEEVQARVRTHLELHRLQRTLRIYSNSLEELVESRTKELVEAHSRLKILDQSKSDFLTLISHEFRSPLNGILGIGELLLEGLPSQPDGNELRDMFRESRRRILTVLEDASLLTQIEVESDRFASKSVPLGAVLDGAAGSAAAFADSRKVSIDRAFHTDALVTGEEDLLSKALQSLLETAVKFSKSGEAVRLFCRDVSGGIEVVIETCGGRIPHTALAKFFDIFAIPESITAGGDLGLGPAVAFRIFSMFGGSISVENREPSGIQLKTFFRSPQPQSQRLADCS